MTTSPAQPTSTTAASSSPTTAAKVVLAGLAAAVVALIGNTVVAQIALAAGASDDFTPLTPGAYGFFTVIGVIAGLVGWLLIRRTANAGATLRWLVPTVLVVSLVPDVLVGFSDQAGASWGAVIALMVMHLIVTIAAVATFARLLPLQRAHA